MAIEVVRPRHLCSIENDPVIGNEARYTFPHIPTWTAFLVAGICFFARYCWFNLEQADFGYDSSKVCFLCVIHQLIDFKSSVDFSLSWRLAPRPLVFTATNRVV